MSIIFNGHYRVKHRTWLLEVLRLHFEEKLPRIEAGRRLGIPKTTACDLFVRFRKAGLSWPLPPRINAKNLDKRKRLVEDVWLFLSNLWTIVPIYY